MKLLFNYEFSLYKKQLKALIITTIITRQWILKNLIYNKNSDLNIGNADKINILKTTSKLQIWYKNNWKFSFWKNYRFQQ